MSAAKELLHYLYAQCPHHPGGSFTMRVDPYKMCFTDKWVRVKCLVPGREYRLKFGWMPGLVWKQDPTYPPVKIFIKNDAK